MNSTKKFNFMFVLSMLVLGAAFILIGCSSSQQKPNIVFILIDDLGWADIGCYGNERHQTPHIDQLASQGMRFTDAYAAAPVCSPTRASIHSGQYPARVGIIDFIPGHWRPYEELTVPTNRTQYLPLDVPTIAARLKTAGYTTAHFGKWHLGWGQYGPEHRGFDVTTPPDTVTKKKSRPQNAVEWLQSVDITDDNPKDVDRLTQLSLDFIQQNRANPFFLYLSHRTVHIPLAAKPQTVEKYQPKPGDKKKNIHPVYSAMVEEMDVSVGKVLQKLDELHLADNTVVIFFSDNGGLVQDYLRVGPICTSNAPLRGEKGTLYEGGIREPLIVRWPGSVKANTICDTPVSSIDFYPTLLDIAGIMPPENFTLDGESLVPVLQQKQALENRALYWHYPVYHHAAPAGAIRQGNWKLIETFADGTLELYNLRADISETNNMVDIEPEIVKALHAELDAWREAVGARLPETNPEFNPAKRTEWGQHPDQSR
ncbi:DUF4976 domain-containing protein [candidate division KSB1 bacterium]|nr:sulfatase [candidate division KSB1 bacterium]RQW01282.1 MAG: DUF4976 domain-containing protein [candidate division KSB1 bacterium]